MSRVDHPTLWPCESPKCSEKRPENLDPPGGVSISGPRVLIDLACETVQGILCRAVEDSSAVIKRDIKSFGSILEDSKKQLALCRLLDRYEFEIVALGEFSSSWDAQAAIEDDLDWLSEYEDHGGSASDILRSVENDGPFHSTLSLRCDTVESLDNLPAKKKPPPSIAIETRSVLLGRHQLKNVVGYADTGSLPDIRATSNTGPSAKLAPNALHSSSVLGSSRAGPPTDLRISARCNVLLDDGVSNPLKTAYTDRKVADVQPGLLQPRGQAYVSDNRSVKTTRSHVRHSASAAQPGFAQPGFGSFWASQQAPRLYSINKSAHDTEQIRSRMSLKSISSLPPDPPLSHRRTSMNVASRHEPQGPLRSSYPGKNAAHPAAPAGGQPLKIAPAPGMKVAMPKSAPISHRTEHALPRRRSADRKSPPRDTVAPNDAHRTSGPRSFSAATLAQIKLPQRSGALPASPETSPDTDSTHNEGVAAPRRKIDDSLPGWMRRSTGNSRRADLSGY